MPHVCKTASEASLVRRLDGWIRPGSVREWASCCRMWCGLGHVPSGLRAGLAYTPVWATLLQRLTRTDRVGYHLTLYSAANLQKEIEHARKRQGDMEENGRSSRTRLASV